MLTSDRERYLGDILTTDGRIDQNIIERYNKGVGKVNEIMGMLQEVSFGPHYFQMAILFRNTILLSSMLCNAEVLYGITQAHVEKLEQADRIFFRRLFELYCNRGLSSRNLYHSSTVFANKEKAPLLLEHPTKGRRRISEKSVLFSKILQCEK